MKKLVIKEAEDNISDKADDTFISYATARSISSDQAQALFQTARNKVAKDTGKDKDKFGAEEMGKLWGAFKDMIKENGGKEPTEKKEEKVMREQKEPIDILLDEMEDRNDHAGYAVVEAVYTGDLKSAKVAFARWTKREEQGYL
jgi:hypothetical protein